MEVAEGIDRTRGTLRKVRVTPEQPALLADARQCIRNGDRAFELFKRAEGQRALRPGTIVRDIEMVASRLGLESRRTVRGDPVTELV
jgi:hypothetical protein